MQIKKAILVTFLILTTTKFFAQAPPGFAFQSIIKDLQGVPAKNTAAYIKCQIIKGAMLTGEVMMEEKFDVKTNADGIFTIVIGQGEKIGGKVFSLYSIDWGHDSYYINIKTAIPANSSIKWYDPSLTYTNMGTTQLWSVPYALFAGRATSNMPTSTADLKSKNPDILVINDTSTVKDVVVGTKDIEISIKPGPPNSFLQTDANGKSSWIQKKDTKLVSGILKIITLGTTTTGSKKIPGNTIVITKFKMQEANIGDPVFVTSMDDVVGFTIYNAFVSAPGEVTIRFANYQDIDTVIDGKNFSVLIIK